MSEKNQPTNPEKKTEGALPDAELDQVAGGTLAGAAQSIGNTGVASTVTSTMQQTDHEYVKSIVSNMRP